MDNKQALKPDVFLSFQEIGDKRTKEEIKKEQDPEDVALHSLASHGGWTVLKKRIEDSGKQMDELVKTLIAEGRSFEDIGKITVVSSLAKEKLYDILKWVQDSSDVVGGE